MVIIFLAILGGGIAFIALINRLLAYNLRTIFSTIMGVLLILILGFTGFLLIYTPQDLDPTTPFVLQHFNLDTPKDLPKIVNLHHLFQDFNLTDPTGFFFDDVPETAGGSRTISIHPNTGTGAPYYFVDIDGVLKPTLLQVPISLTEEDAQNELKIYVQTFLNVTVDLDPLVDIEVNLESVVFGDQRIRVDVVVHDPVSQDVVILILPYSQRTGITDNFNIVYTTDTYIAWNQDPTVAKPPIYLEQTYNFPGSDITMISAFIMIATPALLIGWIFIMIMPVNSNKIKQFIIGKPNF
ncbi:MAG: hypothetical protein ACFFBD_09940 [Candidatus Hodarchaeota archaeon]